MNCICNKTRSGSCISYLALCICLILLFACDRGSETSKGSSVDTGSVNFGLRWENPASNPAQISSLDPGGDVCANYDIDTINASLYNASSAEVASESWPCDAHQGTLSNVPTGSGMRLAVEAVVSDIVLWRGEILDITVSTGTNNVGQVTMTYIGSDTTPPEVVSTDPLDGAMGVDLGIAVSATFSEDVGPAGGGTGFTLMAGATPVSGTVTYDDATWTATFTPDGGLSPATTYTATIAADVDDKAGNPMGADYTWCFATPGPDLSVVITGVIGDGVDVTIYYTVYNNGDGDAAGFEVHVWPDLTSPPVVGDEGDGAEGHTGLAAGSAVAGFVTVSNTLLSGTAYAVVDTDQSVPELNEDNNVSLGYGWPRNVVLFTNTSYVDYSPDSYISEASNLETTLFYLGIVRERFTGITASDINMAVADKNLMIIPELEVDDLNADLDAAARTAIADFVSAGGELMIFADALDAYVTLLNATFGFALSGGFWTGPYVLNAADAIGTVFAGGPASLPWNNGTYDLSTASLPDAALSIYDDGSGNTAVAQIPYGSGKITVFCWDWYDAAPTGLQDDGWVDVLARALNTIRPSVAIVAAADVTYVDDVQTKLGNTGYFRNVSVFDASVTTPSLAELQAFDSVLVFSDSSFDDSVTLGNILADYVDTGGGVVCATFATASRPINGRFNTEGYYVIPPSSQQSGTALTMVPNVPNHPALYNVTGFNGGSSSYHQTSSTIATDAMLVASWSDGIPLIASKEINGVKRADLGFYPPSSDARVDFWDSITDGDLIMANALIYVMRPCELEDGVLYFSKDSDGNGLYRLDTATGQAIQVGITGVTSFTVGLAYDPLTGLLYGSKWSTLLHISRDGYGSVDVGGVGTEGLAYDPTRDVLYGAINGAFFTVDPSNGTKIVDLAAPGFDAEGLAVDPNTGIVYAIGNSTILSSYNYDTNLWTEVGDTGLNWDAGGLAYNAEQHVLYACGTNQGTFLYRIDPDTAVAEVIGDSGVQLAGGLAFATCY